jgi:hypothetical protein
VVEKASPENVKLESFLVSAETRYIRYLLLLEEFVGAINMKGPELVQEFIRTMPLPPWSHLSLVGANDC